MALIFWKCLVKYWEEEEEEVEHFNSVGSRGCWVTNCFGFHVESLLGHLQCVPAQSHTLHHVCRYYVLYSTLVQQIATGEWGIHNADEPSAFVRSRKILFICLHLFLKISLCMKFWIVTKTPKAARNCGHQNCFLDNYYLHPDYWQTKIDATSWERIQPASPPCIYEPGLTNSKSDCYVQWNCWFGKFQKLAKSQLNLLSFQVLTVFPCLLI